ncbi:transmembrane protein 214-B-like isoform X2 [Trifolium pratense]|uniref:transmembrane protein 214-B-like isoform X2 n=1 Tax=Trifolium pratense TaxID=57577 RepID=UPI001E696A18|nr:transmembrane protein 214-B-like isoform X2 [Trifolium pratense]
MAENYAPFDSESNGVSNNSDHGWQKVTYAKKHKKKEANGVAGSGSNKLTFNGNDAAFRSLELHSEDRRRRILEARTAADAEFDDAPVRSKQRGRNYDDDYDEDDDDVDRTAENGKTEEVKKVKQKKPKKPKVTVAEAAAKIDASDLEAFLVDISTSFETKEDIQMMRFADYFGRAFSSVTASQFPWVKLFRELPVTRTVDVPFSHISDAVYKTSADWINHRSPEALSFFLLWSLDSILADLSSQLTVAKGSKKAVQQVTSKSQVAIFVGLAMVLRRKPDALISVLPTLRENTKYQGQDKLPVITWMVAQASVGDLSVGLYAWSRNLLPIVVGKSGNPQTRDLVLQLVEKILSAPKARPVLVNGAVRKGERLIPPPAFETLIRVTFPSSSTRVKATERFEFIYPVLREVALGGSPGSKAMKQVSQQIFSFAIKAAGEDNPALSKEAASIVIWCFSQSSECYKQWEKVYQDNIVASVAVLKKLSDDWKVQATKLSPYEPLREVLKHFRQKNEKALATETDAAHHAQYKDADKYCKIISGRVSQGHGCACLTFTVLAVAVGAVVLYPNLESLDFKNISELFNSQF